MIRAFPAHRLFLKQLADPLFLLYCGGWCLVHACRDAGCPLPLLNGYLTDLIAIPFMAHLTVTIIRTYVVRNHYYRYPFSYLLFMAAYTAVVFEWIMPRCSPVYTGDAWDAAAYFAGAGFYYFVHGRKSQKKYAAA